MKIRSRSKLHRRLRLLFNIMMGIGYLLLSYLILLIGCFGEGLKDNALSILVIAFCSMGQISHYRDAYKGISKNLSYYIGVLPPAIALLCLIFTVTKQYLFT